MGGFYFCVIYVECVVFVVGGVGGVWKCRVVVVGWDGGFVVFVVGYVVDGV